MEDLFADLISQHNRLLISEANAISKFLVSNKRIDRDTVIRRNAERKLLDRIIKNYNK